MMFQKQVQSMQVFSDNKSTHPTDGQVAMSRSWFGRIVRLVRLVHHLCAGLLMVACRYPWLDRAEKAKKTQAWSQKTLNILGISWQSLGFEPSLLQYNTVVVGNHISWVDILLINSVTVSSFVSMDEVARWPLLGFLAKQADTVFINRRNRQATGQVVEQLLERLRQGGCVAFFPEAKTTLGVSLYPFKAALFESILLSQGHVLPFFIRYPNACGQARIDLSFANQSFFALLWALLRQDGIKAEIHYLPPFSPKDLFVDRFALAHHTRAIIAEAAQLPLGDAPLVLHAAMEHPPLNH
jgi:1-acyl-sn-glycerol-3-phosphate acyltransferase